MQNVTSNKNRARNRPFQFRLIEPLAALKRPSWRPPRATELGRHRWKTSLERKPGEAVRFYAAVAVATLDWRAAEFRAHRSREGTVLGRDSKRSCCRAADGSHHDHGV